MPNFSEDSITPPGMSTPLLLEREIKYPTTRWSGSKWVLFILVCILLPIVGILYTWRLYSPKVTYMTYGDSLADMPKNQTCLLIGDSIINLFELRDTELDYDLVYNSLYKASRYPGDNDPHRYVKDSSGFFGFGGDLPKNSMNEFEFPELEELSGQTRIFVGSDSALLKKETLVNIGYKLFPKTPLIYAMNNKYFDDLTHDMKSSVKPKEFFDHFPLFDPKKIDETFIPAVVQAMVLRVTGICAHVDIMGVYKPLDVGYYDTEHSQSYIDLWKKIDTVGRDFGIHMVKTDITKCMEKEIAPKTVDIAATRKAMEWLQVPAAAPNVCHMGKDFTATDVTIPLSDDCVAVGMAPYLAYYPDRGAGPFINTHNEVFRANNHDITNATKYGHKTTFDTFAADLVTEYLNDQHEIILPANIPIIVDWAGDLELVNAANKKMAENDVTLRNPFCLPTAPAYHGDHFENLPLLGVHKHTGFESFYMALLTCSHVDAVGYGFGDFVFWWHNTAQELLTIKILSLLYSDRVTLMVPEEYHNTLNCMAPYVKYF